MSIGIDIYRTVDSRGSTGPVAVRATILWSPREGYDADKLAALERDLGPYIEARLNDALKKGGPA